MPRTSKAAGDGNPTGAKKPKKTALYVEVDPDTHRRFKAACDLRGMTLKDRVLALIRRDSRSAGIPAGRPS